MQTTCSSNRNARSALVAAYMLRIYITLNTMGFSVSLPAIIRQFDALEWYATIVVVGTTASTIISAFSGSIALILGRRATITISTLLTMLFALVCASAPSLLLFIISYFIMSLFSGLASTMPVSVLIDSTLREERPRFMSIYSIMNNLGILLGPLIGGFVTDQFGFFFTPISFFPLAVVALTLMMHNYHPLVSEPGSAASHFDFAGATFLVGGVTSLIVFLNSATKVSDGNTTYLWVLLVAFILFLIMFLLREKHAENAIIPLSLFKVPSFSIANILIPLIVPQMTLSNNFSLLLIQTGLGQSATSSATYVLPKTTAIILVSLFLGRWISYHRKHHKRVILLSGALIGLVELLMGLTGGLSAFPSLLYGYTFLLGIGESMYYMTLYSLYQRDLSPSQIPTGIAAQFLLASLSLSLTSTVYGVILAKHSNDILAAYPVMCFITIVPTLLFLLISAKCLQTPMKEFDPITVSLPKWRTLMNLF